MTSADADDLSVPQLIEELKARVAERRNSGDYPADLEAELDAHFDRIAERIPSRYDHERLHAALGHLEMNMGFSPARIGLQSGAPGGAIIHKTIAKVVSRQTNGVLEQSQIFAEAVRDGLREIVAALEHPNGHGHADMLGQIDALFDRIAQFERAPVDSGAAVADLRQRVEELERQDARRRFEPWFSNADFADAFRGSQDDLRTRYKDLAGLLAGVGSVVDIGCGRGEFVELLLAEGVEASGVEIDPALVSAGRANGLDIVEGDAVGWLRRQSDRSIDAITMIQVIEHLSSQEVLDFVQFAALKLRRDGVLVVETVNPQSLYVYAHPFYLDPTHTQPIHPSYLIFLLEKIGFTEVRVEWRSPPPADDVLEPLPEGGLDDEVRRAHNENVRRLNQLLFGPQDYAVIARR